MSILLTMLMCLVYRWLIVSVMPGLRFGSELVGNVSCFGHEVGAVLSNQDIMGTDIMYIFFRV